MVMSQCMPSVPRAETFGSRYASPPPMEMPKLMACGPSAASMPASVRGNGSGTLWILRSSDVVAPGLSITRAIRTSSLSPRVRCDGRR